MSVSVRALAEAAGLLPEYEDARGDVQTVPDATLAAILDALGLPAASAAARRDSLARLQGEGASHLPPLVTADAGAATPLPVGRPGTRYELRLEGGGTVTGRLGRRGDRATLPPVDAPGYHDLRIGDDRTTLAVSPPACFWPEATRTVRPWGLAAQIYALRRPGDGGIGDFTAIAELAEAAAAAAGADALAISPVHAMFAADPGRASPYSPSNRLRLNGLLVDPSARFGADRVAEAAVRAGLTDTLAQAEAAALIDWPGAATARLALLRQLFAELDPASETGRAFGRFHAEAPDVVRDHALFEALHAQERGPDGTLRHWRDWPSALTSPGEAAHEAAAADEVDFHLFLQWLAEDGLKAAQARARAAGMAIGLIADLAVGADGAGSQAWASRDDLLAGLNIGAPPDIYNAKGQDWGLAGLDPIALRRTGFRAFLAMLRASLAWAGGIRIDHILGLQRIWVIPEGRPPTEGAYLSFPLTDLLRLVTLESHRHQAVVIGEDLGTVPGGLRKELARRRILGMSVLWFEQDRRGFLPPSRWRKETAAMTTTHDLPTIAGWWAGRDLDWKAKLDLFATPDSADAARAERRTERRRLWRTMTRAGTAEGREPPPDAPPVDQALAHVAATPCRLALLPLEDLLGAVEQPNLPGTIDEHPNWRRRLAADAHRLEDEAARRRLGSIAAARAGPPPAE